MKFPQMFLETAFKCLLPGGALAIIEYFVDPVGIEDGQWLIFKEKELELYGAIGSDPRVADWLPEKMKDVGFKEVTSIHHVVSPETITPDSFYSLVEQYVKLYHCIDPKIWTKNIVNEMLCWCQVPLKEKKTSPQLILTHSIGKKFKK